MSPRDFCYFLRGLMEANDDKMPTPEQWDKIVSHLKLVMEEREKPTKWPSLSPEEFEEVAEEMKKGELKFSFPTPTTISCCGGIGGTRYC